MQFYTGSDERMRIDSSGNVGIGTSSPASVLDVSGEAPTLTLRDSRTGGSWTAGTALGKLDFYTSDSTGIGAHSLASVGVVAGGANTASPDGELVFATGGYNAASTERMRIDSVGNVGIGTSSPSAKMHLESTSGNHLRVAYNSSFYWDIEREASTGSLTFTDDTAGEVMRLDGSGNLLVGTTSNPYSGRIVGYGAPFVSQATGTSASDRFYFVNGNGIVGYIQTSGSSTSYNTSSDQRLKDNIADADDAGSKIDSIQVRKYDWKADGSHQDYGMIAQELQAVAPEAVSGDADSEDMMGVDYSKLVPMLIKEIQSLRNRVAQLEE
jgi:hypothetical protein